MRIYTHDLLNMMDAGSSVVGKKLRGMWVYSVDRQPATDAVKTLLQRGMAKAVEDGSDAVVVRA